MTFENGGGRSLICRPHDRFNGSFPQEKARNQPPWGSARDWEWAAGADMTFENGGGRSLICRPHDRFNGSFPQEKARNQPPTPTKLGC